MSARKTFAVACGVTAFFLLASPLGFAQEATRGEIRGTVKDTAGGVLPGVTITAVHVQTGGTRPTTTSETGLYRLPALALGEYAVTAELQGFKTIRREGITLGLGQTLTVDFTLEVGAIAESITVIGEVPLIDTSNPQVSGLLQPSQIVSLPLIGRNWMELGMLMPGVSSTATHTRGVAVGRGDVYAQNVLIDGVDSRDECCVREAGAHSQEAVAEFKIITNNFSAEYGRSSGYVLTAVTKSGTNALRGTAFYLFRDEKFDKADFFTKVKEPIKYYQVGGSVGGPIKKDRVFFFGVVEYQDDGRTAFSKTGFAELDRWKIPVKGTQPWLMGKVDLQLPAAQRLSAKYYYWHYDDLNSGRMGRPIEGRITPWSAEQTFISNQGLAVNHTWTGTKRLNELTVGFTAVDWERLGYGGVPVREGGFRTGGIDSPRIIAPSFELGYHIANPQIPGLERKFELKNHFSYFFGFHGDHHLKVGGGVILGLFDLGWFRNTRGQLRFVRDPADPFDFNAYPEPTRFLMSLGRSTAPCPKKVSAQVQQEFDRLGSCGWYAPIPFQIYAGFIQDNWNITPDLTLNLGVRYEVEVGMFAEDYLDRVRPQLDPQIPHATRSDVDNVTPRVGFSYRLGGEDKTVIRGGTGIYSNTTILNVPLNKLVNDGWNTIEADQPFPTRQPCFQGHTLEEAFTQNPKLLLPGCGQLSFEQLYAGAPKAIFALDPSKETERALQSSIGVAHQLTDNLTVEVDFVHSRVEDANFAADTNLFFDPETKGPKDPSIFGRPDPRFTAITTMSSDGKARYKALLIRVNKRLSQNYQFQVNYALTSSRDNVDTGPSPEPDNPFDKEEWGPSAGSHRHRISTIAILDELPLGLQLSAILVAHSGPHYDDRVAGDFWKLGRATSRAYRAPDGTVVRLQRNSNVGKPFAKLDLRVAKWFKLGGEREVAVIAELFNVPNRKNYGVYGDILGSRTYRQPLRSPNPQFAPLKGQLGVRFVF